MPKQEAKRHLRVALPAGLLTLAGVPIVLALFSFRPFQIPSASMLPTLFVGDSIIVRNVRSDCNGGISTVMCSLSAAPLQRGDIIVFRSSVGGSAGYVVKRLIGLPGDHVEIRRGTVFLNGNAVSKRLIAALVYHRNDGAVLTLSQFVETLPNNKSFKTIYGYYPAPPLPSPRLNDTQAIAVTPKHYFVLGDDRDRSFDSRMSVDEGGTGLVAADDIVGVASFVLYSVANDAPTQSVLDVPMRIRWERCLRTIR